MSLTLILGLATGAGAVAYAGRQLMTPRCPRCRGKDWDRKLCAPLLMCRRCATRIDHAGKLYN
jgi:hypothetical protein